MTRIPHVIASIAVLFATLSCGDLLDMRSGVSLELSPTHAELPPAGTQEFTVTVIGTEDKHVEWSATDGTIVGTGATVTFVAPSRPGSHTVTARSVADPAKAASATVSVRAGTEFEPVPSYVHVDNTTLLPTNVEAGTRDIRFDIGWNESWRGPFRPSYVEAVNNWDAAWVFVKYRTDAGPWLHASIRTSGHTQLPGVAIDTPPDGRGVFVYREAPGYGTFEAHGVQLVWDIEADALNPDADVEVLVHGIDMVFVPQGRFFLGTGGTEWNPFLEGSTTEPFEVVAQAAIHLGSQAGQLNWVTGNASGEPVGQTNPAFPTGFEAFYMMKYELTQGQYVAFLNTLTQEQAEARLRYRCEGFRHAITGSRPGAYHTTLPYVAMPCMSWADGAAFADWAGLRPMTELEFEKAARGPLSPLTSASPCWQENVWGTTRATYAAGFTDAGLISERPSPQEANVNGSRCGLESIPGAPLRVGSFAAPGKTREQAGAAFYGVMDLAGNVQEPIVTVGNPQGRAFTGTHGDGALDPSGDANEAGWPGVDSIGGGVRGGGYYSGIWSLWTSSRWQSAFENLGWHEAGWRGVRSAP